MSTKEFGHMNEDLEEIKKKYQETKKRWKKTKEAKKQRKNTADNYGNQKKNQMKNITINIPNIYDDKIQWLIKKKILPSRSEGIRTAIREFLHAEYNTNLELLGFFDHQN